MFVDESRSDSRIQKKKRIVRNLVQNDISESAAKAAVQAVGSLDVDECFLWAMEYDYDTDRVTALQRDFDEELGNFFYILCNL